MDDRCHPASSTAMHSTGVWVLFGSVRCVVGTDHATSLLGGMGNNPYLG